MRRYHLFLPLLLSAPAMAQDASPSNAHSAHLAFLNSYCSACHNDRQKSGGLSFNRLDVNRPGDDPASWERVVTKLRSGMMPPVGLPRPDETTYQGFRKWLESELDRAAAGHLDPGRTEVFHRLNRTEYQNAVRDLLALEVRAADLLPADDSSNGFDNMAGTLRISDSLMERYLSAARTISRMAIGTALSAPDSRTYRIAPDLQQHDRIEGLPFGTRGGTLIRHVFPRDADYDFKIDLAGLQRAGDQHQMEVSVDGEQIKVFTLAGGRRGASQVRTHVLSGPHEVVVTFFRKPADLLEQIREPFENPRISGNDGGPGGSQPQLAAVTIVGPYNDKGPGDTPSRRRIFICQPAGAPQEPECARRILTALAHRAYRGPLADGDVDSLLKFYNAGRAGNGSFEDGIELAIRRLLVSPQFLFRIEADPKPEIVHTVSSRGGSFVYRLGDIELASRLSFFIWSSIPDDELLRVAEQGRLHDPAEYQRQVRRMIADPKSESLSTNFADEWLQLRNLEIAQPSDPFTLAFDETLRRSMKRETELFFDSILRENRPALELLTANYTFLDQRLAEHYGISNVQGSDFRRVTLDAGSLRSGLLGQGSILTITSHPNRTSPVLRGKFILKNLLGTPPADPPPNVPALPENKTQARVATMRERMAGHRANPACASCHNIIDPAGFALENFDAIGRWRIKDESFNALDASGALPDGTKFDDLAGLRTALVKQPDRFVTAVTEKLLAYALGRGVEYYDMPSIRGIVGASAPDGYRLQAIVMGIVNSQPFLMRRVDAPHTPVAVGPSRERVPAGVN